MKNYINNPRSDVLEMFDKIRAALEDVILSLSIDNEKHRCTYAHELLLTSAEEALKTNARMRETFRKWEGSVGSDLVSALADYLERLELVASHESDRPFRAVVFPDEVVGLLSEPEPEPGPEAQSKKAPYFSASDVAEFIIMGAVIFVPYCLLLLIFEGIEDSLIGMIALFLALLGVLVLLSECLTIWCGKKHAGSHE